MRARPRGDHGGSHASLDHRKRAVPASASLSIAAVADQVGGLELPDPVALAPGPARRCWPGWSIRASAAGSAMAWSVVLTAAVCAVAAGARSFVAIAEWVADLPAEVAAALGIDRRCPSESAIRRLLGQRRRRPVRRRDRRVRAAACAPRVAPAGRRRVLAVDGKTLRGSRHTDTDGAPAGPAPARGDRPARPGRARAGRRRRQDQRDHRVRPAARHPDRPRPDRGGDHRRRAAHPTRPRRDLHAPRRALGADGEGQPAPAAPPARRAALARGRDRPPQRRDRPRPPRDPHPQGRHHRRRDRVPARRAGHPDHPPHPPGLRPHRHDAASGAPRPSTRSPTCHRTRPDPTSSPPGSAGTGRSRTACTGSAT